MVTNNEKMAYYFLPLVLAFLLGFAGGCGLTLFIGENLSDHGNGAFQTGIGLGQSLNGERETERTVREAQDTAQNLEDSVGREEESLRDGKKILRRVRQRGAEKTGET